MTYGSRMPKQILNALFTLASPQTSFGVRLSRIHVRSDWSVSHLPFARGCTPRNWGSAVKLKQIQQIFSPVGKMHRWNVQMKSGGGRKYSVVFLKKKVKRSSNKFALDVFITVFFTSRSGEEKLSERSFFRIFIARDLATFCVFL